MEKRIVLELRGEKRAECTSLDLSECKTGGEWEVNRMMNFAFIALFVFAVIGLVFVVLDQYG